MRHGAEQPEAERTQALIRVSNVDALMAVYMARIGQEGTVHGGADR